MSARPVRLLRLALPLILLLAAVLRFYRLSFQSLWSDEGNSVALARAGFVEIAQRTAFDIHPPLYYWLLKLWTALFGFSEAGVRSLSVVLGVALVLVTAQIGTRLFGPRVGIISALIAAISPFQVYYAQEARMYTLLALLGAVLVWASLGLFEGQKPKWSPALLYLSAATSGLYTHYAFPVVLAAVNLAALAWLWQRRSTPGGRRRAGRWALWQLIPLLLYAPWLPIAWRQISAWPNLSEAAPPGQIALSIVRLLSLGLSVEAGQALPLVLFGALLIGGLIRLVSHRLAEQRLLLLLWLVLPTASTFFLFRPAYLKFLLVASPAFSIVLALGLGLALKRRGTGLFLLRLLQAGALGLLILLSGQSLSNYYFKAAYHRDNYRGIAGFIAAVAQPGDVVILDAPGQREVFDYYFQGGLPVYPLPRARPLDVEATLDELAAIAATANNVYAVYWATTEADPTGLIEATLAEQSFKASDWWYGNVRLASYAIRRTAVDFTPVEFQFGAHIRLTGFGLLSQEIAPGRIVPLTLRWQSDAPFSPGEDYVVFIQILDGNDHLVGQRDARPRRPTTAWQPDQTLEDNHGIYLEPGTPPGEHRLIVGLYDAATGQRLPVVGENTDFVELARPQVVKPEPPLLRQAFAIQNPRDSAMFEARWLGYDLYKVGHASEPETPIHSGDAVHLVLYFGLDRPAHQLTDQLLLQVVTGRGEPTSIAQVVPLAGTGYSVQAWDVGEIVRAQFDVFLAGLPAGNYRFALTATPTEAGASPVTRTTGPFQVE